MEELVKIGEKETDPTKAVLTLAEKMATVLRTITNCPKCTGPLRPVKFKCVVCGYEKEVKHDAKVPEEEQKE